ncbi:MAG TPA: EthD domain-containing protein [Candidatus Acidoferrum sp.]|nr:EthD domain-containing protein [Candidatus Acidoferrum sp.]
MIKFVYVVRRRPDVSPEAFRKYWLEKHGPLVRSQAKALRAKRYVQSHTLDTPLNGLAQQARGTQPPYDGVTELWFDKFEDLLAAAQSPEAQQANMILARDEATFCDLPNCSVFFTEEHTIF